MSGDATTGPLWRRQVLGVWRFELLRMLLGKRSIFLYILAAVTLFPFVGRVILFVTGIRGEETQATLITVYANVFSLLMLRFTFFFAIAWVFMNLIRGDMLDRTMHTYFLAPLRRDVLLAAKYGGGLIVTSAVLGSLVLVSFVLTFAPLGNPLQGPLLGHLISYLMVSTMACLGYGGVFLMFGTLMRNPILPVALVSGWEWLNPVLPVWLKKFSVIHFLNSLLPVHVSQGPLAVLVEPTPWYFSLPGFLLLSAALLWFAGYRLRAMEINYSSD